MTVLITRVSSPELFVGSDDDPRQILRVELDRAQTDGALAVQVSGDGVTGTADLPSGEGSTLLEVPLEVSPRCERSTGRPWRRRSRWSARNSKRSLATAARW